MATPDIKVIAQKFAVAFVPDVAIDSIRRTRLATTEEGYTRGERIDGEIHPRARWSVSATEVLATEGTDYDTLEDQVAATSTLYLPIASPAFTGTLTGPDITLSATLTAVGLVITGNSNLGNSASDIILMEGHTRHKGNAPSIAVGVALGTGGSVDATIDGTDEVGVIRLVAGTSSLTTGVLATITFADARPNTNYSVVLDNRNSTAAANAIQRFQLRDSASAWTIRCNVAPASGNTYDFFYQLREWT